MDICRTLKEKLEHKNPYLTDEEAMQMSQVLRTFSFVQEDGPSKRLDDRIADFYARCLDTKLAGILVSFKDSFCLSYGDLSEIQRRAYLDSRILHSYSNSQNNIPNLDALEKKLKESKGVINESFALTALSFGDSINETIDEDWLKGDCYSLSNPTEPPYLTGPSVWIHRDKQSADIGEDSFRHCISLGRDEWNRVHQMACERKSPRRILDDIDSLVSEKEMEWSGGPHLDVSYIQNLITGIKAGKLKSFK